MGIMYKAPSRPGGRQPLTWTGVYVIVFSIVGLVAAIIVMGAK
jgi:hypothetical protein